MPHNSEGSQVVSVKLNPGNVGKQEDTTTTTTTATQKPTVTQPCIMSGLYSAASAGMLGFFFGAIPSMAKNRSLAARGLWASDGWKSAQALALVSGMYTWIHCLCQRLRLKDDGFNRGAAGCATGLVLGWKGGPSSALQSCAGFGFISYILDFGGSDTPPANAASSCSSASCSVGLPGLNGGQQDLGVERSCSSCLGQGLRLSSGSGVARGAHAAGKQASRLQREWWQRQQHQQRQQLAAVAPVMWLGSVLNPCYFQG